MARLQGPLSKYMIVCKSERACHAQTYGILRKANVSTKNLLRFREHAKIRQGSIRVMKFERCVGGRSIQLTAGETRNIEHTHSY